MLMDLSVNLNNLLLSLSDAIDLANPQIATHQMRTAYIAWRIAIEAGLDEARVKKIYLGALFHDIGALKLEEKVKIHNFEDVNIGRHCRIGAMLFETLPLFEPSSNIVRYHHHNISYWGENYTEDYMFDAQILYLADYLERKINKDVFILDQVKALSEEIQSSEGIKFDKVICGHFYKQALKEEFWLDLTSQHLYSILFHHGPFKKYEVGYDSICKVADLFRCLIDFRSPFTSNHTTGVAESAVQLSMLLGLTEAEIKMIRIAAYFHDLGKLAIPASILEKPGKLTENEFNLMKKHTYLTYTILKSVGGLDKIAEWAAFHHEKLDGSGYPFRLDKKDICINCRILAVADMFTALIEDRPYRKGMLEDEVKSILRGDVAAGKLDGRVVDLLLANYKTIENIVKAKQASSQSLFDTLVANKDLENEVMMAQEDHFHEAKTYAHVTS